MRKRFSKIAVFLICLSILSLSFSGQPVIAEKANQAGSPIKHTLPVSETGIYIVRLQDASLASYRGGVSSLAATNPEVTGVRRLDTKTAESQAYLDYLGRKQADLLGHMTNAYGRPVDVVYQYKNVLNAVAAKLEYAEALQAFNLPGVSAVYPDRIHQLDTDIGPTLIGAPHIWNGDTLDGLETFGEGIIIGVIDTGINHAHPSFASVGGDGYEHTNPYINHYVGYCVENEGFCNDKLIGAYDMLDLINGNPEDLYGHGSHTASTAAGNFVDLTVGDEIVTISGVAPHASLIAYRVCDQGGCYDNASIASVDQAIEDGVSVLNYSISGSDDPWNDAVDLAFLDAYAAGILVSASAGNAGPNAGTVAKTGPWNAAVAASTHGRELDPAGIDVWTGTGALNDIDGVEGTGPALTSDLTAPILYGGDINPENLLGCNEWPVDSFSGKIGLVQRGTCNFSIKVNNLAAAGAIGAIVFNNADGDLIIMAELESTTIPSMFISLSDGTAVVDLIQDDVTAMATLRPSGYIYEPTLADIIADFSSRGPSQWELLKPDYTAPGVNVLAAVAAYGNDAERYGIYSGTSMAAPHGAGSAALLMALHPDWSPAEIKSAIALTTSNTLLKEDGVTPATPLDGGSGRIDLAAAAFAGLVMDESTDNYIAANPYLGGEPNSLNQPSMVEYDCIGSCSWTRTFTGTLPYRERWQVTYTSHSDGLTLPGGITTYSNIGPGDSFEVETAATTDFAHINKFLFGEMILTPQNTDLPVIRLPIVVYSTWSNLPSQIDIVTDQLAGTETLEGVQSWVSIENALVDIDGMAPGVLHNISLGQDPTNGNPFDELNDIFWTTVSVPPGSTRLVAELVKSDAPDLDLFVGTGTIPSEATIQCISATGVWDEYCNIDNPDMGSWWILVQNWQGSGAAQDAIRLVTSVVTNTVVGNLTVSVPNNVPAQELFDVGVNWNEPSMPYVSDYWYANFTLRTSGGGSQILGSTKVNLIYTGPFYDVDLDPATLDGYGDPGEVVEYSLTLTNYGNMTDTFTVSVLEDQWAVDMEEGPIDLAPGESLLIPVEVIIPEDAVPGQVDSIRVSATSNTYSALTTATLINTHVNADYSFDLTPVTLSGSGDPGTVVTYHLTLTNLGNAVNTITLVPGISLWNVSIPVASFDVPVGGSVVATVEVNIPVDAEIGDMDSVTITATAEGGQVKTSVLTTTAGPITHTIWMPFIAMPEE